MRVVIADDILACRKVLRVMLRSEGHTIAGECADGLTAIELCRELRPDLAILDVSMPNSGDLAAEVIHRERLARHIMIASSVANAKIQRLISEIGAIRCTKPFKRGQFPAILAQLKE